MKKILSLFALLMTIVIGAQADYKDLSFTATKTVAAGGEIWYPTSDNVATANTAGWCSKNGNGSNNKYGDVTPNLEGDVVEETPFKIDGVLVKGGNIPTNLTTSKKALVVKFTNATSVTIYGATTSGTSTDNAAVRISIYNVTDGAAVVSNQMSDYASPNHTAYTTVSSLDADKTYIFCIDGGFKNNSTSNQDVVLYAVKFTAPSAGPVDPVFSVSKTSFGIDETAKILVDGKDIYGANFNNPTTLWETHTGGPYISLGVDGTITPLKKTPEGYGFHFFADSKDAEKYNSVTSSTLYINITDPVVATPTLTAGGIFTTESKTVEIACETEGATIKYSYDNETWTTYTEALNITETKTVYAKAVKEGSIDSEVASATYTKFVPDPLVDVTGTASWDWSKFGTAEIKLTDATTPSKTTEFVLSDIVEYGMCSDISADFGDAQQLKVTAEYVVRDSKYLQGASIKFNTTVPGIVTVKYTNTGNRSSEDDRRFLNINGTNYGEGTMSSKEGDAVTTAVPVSAGEVAIKGTLKKDGSDQYLRYYTITFTPTINVVLGANGYSTFRAGQNVKLVSGATVYAAKIQDDAVVLSAVDADAIIGAEEGVILKGEEGATAVFTPIIGEAAELDNDLIGANALTNFDDYTYPYVLASNGTKTSFVKLTSDYYDEMFGKAFIVYAGMQEGSLDIQFEGEATAINNVNANDNANSEAPVKVIKNGKLFIGNYNVAGQQVK